MLSFSRRERPRHRRHLRGVRTSDRYIRTVDQHPVARLEAPPALQVL
jgi:hypothetical protein